MKTSQQKDPKLDQDRIEGNSIILNGQGEFPKRVIIVNESGSREYRIIKTRTGGYILNS